ncbi:MAG: helix-turn-helix transcriptional regulator [Halioglobus sp.]|nr:helix-turn-helix transcriptional regulator [Halioglobus sp.]
MKFSAAAMADRAGDAERFLKQLANSKRLMVLCTLIDGERSVGELNEQIAISQSALSQHLARLREAGFVRTRREAQTIYYRLADARVKTVIRALYSVFCRP